MLVSFCLLNSSICRLLVDDHNQGISVLDLDSNVGHCHLDLLLETFNLSADLLHGVETLLEVLDLSDNCSLLLSQEPLVEADETKEGSRGSVIVTAHLSFETLVCVVDRQVHVRHMLGKSFLNLLARKLNLLEEARGDIDERILRPGEEPINGSAVNETGEHSGTDSEGVADRREAQGKMVVLARFVLEILKQGSWGVFDTGTLCFRAKLAEVAIKLIFRVEISDPTRRQQIVDVDEELLLGDLAIR